MRNFLVGLTASVLAAGLVGCDAGDDAIDDINESGGVAVEGGGNPFDQQNPGRFDPFDPAKADSTGYVAPTVLPRLVDPRVVVSLAGFSIELIDDETGFYKVYPTGVGALGSSGRSFTPVGEFKTGSDPSENWWYYARRYNPSYFGGFPFLRITAENSQGYNTYGFHGPITSELIRGYVSHGCMRMQGADIVEMFTILKKHPGTPVSIQAEKRFTEDGELVDVTPPELDPVVAYQAMVDACKDEARDAEEALTPGSYEAFGLCGADDHFFATVGAGDKVQVTVTSADAAIDLVLRQGDAIETAEPKLDAELERWTTEVSLRAGEDGVVDIDVLGDLVNYDITLEVAKFAPEG